MGTIEDFHKLYYGERWNEIYGRTFYRGYPCLKCPLDLWIYQEIFTEYKPEVIIELGTFNGGSALWIGDTVKNIGLDCEVVTVDMNGGNLMVRASNVEYIVSSSVDDSLVQEFYKKYADKKVIVILDSDHTKSHVLNELNSYCGLIKSGGYIIVEDTNVNGHPVRPDWGEGPAEAVEEFLRTHSEFSPDQSRHKFFLTFNYNGYLKRK